MNKNVSIDQHRLRIPQNIRIRKKNAQKTDMKYQKRTSRLNTLLYNSKFVLRNIYLYIC